VNQELFLVPNGGLIVALNFRCVGSFSFCPLCGKQNPKPVQGIQDIEKARISRAAVGSRG
jgi:hypothetical protein